MAGVPEHAGFGTVKYGRSGKSNRKSTKGRRIQRRGKRGF